MSTKLFMVCMVPLNEGIRGMYLRSLIVTSRSVATLSLVGSGTVLGFAICVITPLTSSCMNETFSKYAGTMYKSRGKKRGRIVTYVFSYSVRRRANFMKMCNIVHIGWE